MEAFSYPINNIVFSPPSTQLFDDNFLQTWSDDVQNQQYKLFSSFSSDIKIQNLENDLIKKIEVPSKKSSSSPSPSSVEVKAETDTKTTSRSRKKRKRTDDEDTGGDISFVMLSREELLEMSSTELENRVKLLQQQRPLTTAEKDEIQRQRKLIKNREYAQTSRLKKRETLSILKGRLEEVSSQNVVLQTQVNHLTQRNRELELENQQLRVLWNQTTQTYVPAVPYPVPTTNPYTVPTTTSGRPYVPETPYSATSCRPNVPETTPYPGNRPFTPETPSYSETGSPSSPSTEDYESLLGSITSDSDDTGSFSLDVPLQFDLPLFSNTTSNCTNNPGNNLGGGGWGFPDPYASLCLLVILFSFGLFFNWGVPGQEIMVFNYGHSKLRKLEGGDFEDDFLNTDLVGLEDTLGDGGGGFDGKPFNLDFYFGNKVVLNVTEEIGEGENEECQPGMLVAITA